MATAAPDATWIAAESCACATSTGDGRADEVKVFAKVDSPRGVAVDGNKLYVLHPPDLSVFIDKDGDGIADEKRTLVKGIGFESMTASSITPPTESNPAWMAGYTALLATSGMLNAEGTDGRKLTLRGGGVVRVRTDGTGLELYSRGTRNILEAAVSPLLDVFARDNTNDGDGWDVRFHHSTALGDTGTRHFLKTLPMKQSPRWISTEVEVAWEPHGSMNRASQKNGTMLRSPAIGDGTSYTATV